MSIDTVRLRSPLIDYGTAAHLDKQSVLKQGIDCSTGEFLYEFTSGNLEGSWDSRISFRVERSDWVTVNGRLEHVPCDPFVIVECSLHKFFYGQNIYGNPCNFQERCRIFINLLGEMLGSDHQMFHDAEKWQVRRVDWAENYQLSHAAQREFFQSMERCRFPRRDKGRALTKKFMF